MIRMSKTWPALVLPAVAAVWLAACSAPSGKAPATPEGPFVRYSVTGSAVTIATAVTPFDAEPKEREAFLHWFQRGFDTGFAGHAPLMIEWADTPVARAGRQGYEFGLAEGERLRKEGAGPDRSPQTAPIPPGGN